MSFPIALTIAGSDSGGGAGIQADLKTFSALGVYGCSVITAITAQNTRIVSKVYPMTPEAVVDQLRTVLEDISVDALKTGMLANEEIVRGVVSELQKHPGIPLVVDPVMLAKSGDALLSDKAAECLRDLLLPLATVLTPNIPEAEVLVGKGLEKESDYMDAARSLHKLGARCVIVKGGHRPIDSSGPDREIIDLFFDGVEFHEIRGPWIDTPHTHGTGCTFASAITAFLAKGLPMQEAIQEARTYLSAALLNAYKIGGGKSPVHHFHRWWR
jgi:hydroxymethylpyrimidine/phosphomethylpyrimidine kinase